jgi:hypothetical protein
MAVINVLYLPRDERLRTIVRTALDFVEEVYKQEFLAGIRFASFDEEDSVDVEQAMHVAVREGFTNLVKHSGCEPKIRSLNFFIIHSNTRLRYAWVPTFKDWIVTDIYDAIVHEITHLAFGKLPEDLRGALITSFRKDTKLDDIVRRHGYPLGLVCVVRSLVEEATVMYIVDNYFLKLMKNPATPTNKTRIKDITLEWLSTCGFEIEDELLGVLVKLFRKLTRSDLASLRATMHQTFETMINKFPADVLESNRAKYGVLYRREPLIPFSD